MKRFPALDVMVRLGVLLFVLMLVGGCSLDDIPTTSTGDGDLDAGSRISSEGAPMFLHRAAPLAKAAHDDGEEGDAGEYEDEDHEDGSSALHGEKWIDDKGGKLKVGDKHTGKSSIEVRKGALKEATLIRMVVSAYGDIMVDLYPSGLVSRKPCRVKLSYKNADLTGIDEADLRAWYWNADAGVWENLGGEVDTKQQQVIFDIDHFSRYALAPCP